MGVNHTRPKRSRCNAVAVLPLTPPASTERHISGHIDLRAARDYVPYVGNHMHMQMSPCGWVALNKMQMRDRQPKRCRPAHTSALGMALSRDQLHSCDKPHRSATYLSLEGVVEARLVTADAGVDFICSALRCLPHPEWVCKEGPAERTHPHKTAATIAAREDLAIGRAESTVNYEVRNREMRGRERHKEESTAYEMPTPGAQHKISLSSCDRNMYGGNLLGATRTAQGVQITSPPMGMRCFKRMSSVY